MGRRLDFSTIGACREASTLLWATALVRARQGNAPLLSLAERLPAGAKFAPAIESNHIPAAYLLSQLVRGKVMIERNVA